MKTYLLKDTHGEEYCYIDTDAPIQRVYEVWETIHESEDNIYDTAGTDLIRILQGLGYKAEFREVLIISLGL